MDQQAAIRIQKWSVELYLGIYPEEETSPQSVIFDLTLEGPWSRASEGDLSLTLDYSWLKTVLEEFWQSKKWGLLESLAEATLEFCFENTHGEVIDLEITKPGALAPALVSYKVHRSRGSL